MIDLPWWGVAWAVAVGGGWAGKNVRRALLTRHERKLQRLAAEERRQLALDAANKPPEPVCGCTHHLAKHDKQGKCHEMVEVPTAWDAERKPVSYEPRRCNCQQYVGPQPLATVYAEEIVDLE
jgi:hypothetical protein